MYRFIPTSSKIIEATVYGKGRNMGTLKVGGKCGNSTVNARLRRVILVQSRTPCFRCLLYMSSCCFDAVFLLLFMQCSFFHIGMDFDDTKI